MFSCIYKLSHSQFPRIKFQINSEQMEGKNHEVGILKVFKSTNPHLKREKYMLPVIFLVRLKKGAQPAYFAYKTLREQHPYYLIEFFQKRSFFRNNNDQREQPPPLLEENEDPKIEAMEMSAEIKKENSERTLKIKRIKKEQKKQPQKSQDQRPKRSCRLRSDYPRENPPQVLPPPPPPLCRQPSNQLINNERQSQIRPLSHSEQPYLMNSPEQKKILDYDYLVQSSYCLNLISPAVIPTIKPRIEPAPPIPLMSYPLVGRMSFKEMQRDPFSSQQIKESEQSEFLLDDRGKQKRKKQKMMRQQQRLNRKKKSRRIKKKIKTAKH